jgi:1-phosphatidylinositol-3-phosphate 5-kinase
MFLETGFQYFHHKAKFLFHKMPSAIAKILGAYKIKIKIRQNKIENRHIFLMENLFYDLDMNKNLKCYDLKGSKSRRYIAKRDHKPNQVLPDTNFKEDFKGEPIPLEKNIYELMKAAVHNDSLILSKMNVVDYSLLLIIDDADGEESSSKRVKRIRIGIIDYCRKYTWDKQLEHVGKIIINRLQVPTIVNPINYKERFKEAISNYFIGL